MSRVKIKQFEFDLETKELWLDGQVVALQPKQADVLSILLANPDTLVSREEIKERAWGDTVVEFDQSINFCIKGIRRTLGDNPKKPVFIQTIPRRGYRFVAPVESIEDAEKPLNSQLHSASGEHSLGKKYQHFSGFLKYVLASGAGLVFAVSAALWWSNVVQPDLSEPLTGEQKDYEEKLVNDFKRSLHAFKNGDYETSRKMFGNILNAYPEYPDVHAYYGISTLYAGAKNASELLKQHSELAAFHHPDSAMTAMIKGITALHIDWDVNLAHSQYELAVAKSPDLTMGWHELAVTSAILQDLSLASTSIEMALKLDPGAVQERYHAGWFYMVAQDYENALSQCEQTIELQPEHRFSHKCAAESALALGLTEIAKRYYLSMMALYDATEESKHMIEEAMDERNYAAFYQWLFETWKERQAPAFFLASAKASSKDYDAANEWLLQSIEHKEPYLPLVLAFPEFKPLYDQPAFDTVKQQIAL